MGLFHNLLETYDKCSDAVGIVQTDEHGNGNEKRTLLPIFHTMLKTEFRVIISESGNFISAQRDLKEKTIVAPCTEESEGRANDKKNPQPHPLCDQLDYIAGIKDKACKNYLKQLFSWKKDNISLNAIYTYIAGGTILEDLINAKLFKDSELLPTDNELEPPSLDIEKIRKLGVRFTVEIGDRDINVWEDKDIRSAWIAHLSKGSESDTGMFDYLSGEKVNLVSSQHPKKINAMTGNAKLISCNDTSGFTFRGRFFAQNDAVIIDYTQSQKMHQMLRWLIANYGYSAENQVIITWAVDDNTEVVEKVQYSTCELFNARETVITSNDSLTEAKQTVHAEYALKMRRFLQGMGNEKYIKEHSRKICIAAFDAATTGRMALVFYQELPENDYLESIVRWHKDTSYFLTAWKKEKDEKGKDKNVPINYLGAPSYDDIVFAVYGRARGDKSYDTLKKKTRKQLLECMFGSYTFPSNLVQMAANRASNPMSFSDSNGKFTENDWKRSINITCALARNYYKHQKEEIQLELEPKRTDRDYLYGRLLSVADRLEKYALHKSDKQDTRTTNAVRLMSAFQVKPNSTWGQLYSQLIPYKNQLYGAGFYQNLIDEILTLFQDGDYESNLPLSPLYLLGYSAQNRALYKNKTENSGGTPDDNITE